MVVLLVPILFIGGCRKIEVPQVADMENPSPPAQSKEVRETIPRPLAAYAWVGIGLFLDLGRTCI